MVKRAKVEAMKFLRDERGNVLVLAALSGSMLVSFLALAVDAGNVYYTQRNLQTLADAAAIAGALEISACNGTAKCSAMTTAANYAFTTENSAPTGATLTINNGPSALGTNDPNNGKINYVEAVVTQTMNTYFAGIFGAHSVSLYARSEAGYATSTTSTGPGLVTNNLTLNSGASVTQATGSTCGIYDNATSGLSANSGVTIDVNNFNYVGSSYNKNCGSCTTYNPLPTINSATKANPFASLTAPSQPSTSSTNVGTISGNTTLSPGYYSNDVNFNSGTYTVTLNPGVYYFGSGFSIDSDVTINGTGGVTIFIGSGASVNINSAANWNITAPTAAQITADPTAYDSCTSCANMAIWDTGSALNLDAASGSTFGGSVYVPNGTLTLNGGSTASAYGSIYASSVMLDSAISLKCSGGGSTSGSPYLSLAE
jgi:Flp pilus assembly protein TadG